MTSPLPRCSWLCLLVLAPVVALRAQSPGEAFFQSTCSICHGADGSGTDRGPALYDFVASNSEEKVSSVIRSGQGGMPPHSISDPAMKALVTFIKTLSPPRGATATRMGNARLADGRSLRGIVRSESAYHLNLVTDDGRMHSLTRTDGVYRENPVEPKRDWPSYDGGYTGNRYSPLDQINAGNVARLAPRWFYPMPNTPRIESTPVVVDGVMYVTAVNEAHAIDAVTGRQLWRYSEPRTPGILGEAGGGANRGVALLGDRVFMVTDHAHLWALDRRTGRKVWDTEMADHVKEQYSATGAPLVVGDLVIAGVAGGEEGVRGFVDAYKSSTGERVWRFWTIPKRGEKLAETWIGTALDHGCGATWLTGSYDPALDLLYWSVGNPCPDFNGDQRKGDNLYTGSVVALKPQTGELKWYFQFTPHDTHDWDASQPMLLVDEQWQGRARQLLVHADRNGYFFVLDRTNGELLLAKPYLDKVTWTSGFGQDGHPVLLPGWESTPEGSLVCPAATGGTNWMSSSYSPRAKLFFFQANETCAIYKSAPGDFKLGERFFGGTSTVQPGRRGNYRALDIQTGATVWNYPLVGGGSISGTLSTAGDVVFFGDAGGAFTAVGATTGKPLWHFDTGTGWRASPMTYMVGGRQYVAIGSPSGFFSFALPGE